MDHNIYKAGKCKKWEWPSGGWDAVGGMGGVKGDRGGAVECFWLLALVCQYVGMSEMGTVGEKACHHLHSTATVF